MSKDFVPEQSSAEMSLEEILEQLNQPDLDELPVEALRAAQSRRDEVIPHLVSFLQNAAQAAVRGDETIYDREGHVFALYLLAEFRATEALPVILALLSLPGDFARDLFGEIISVDLGRILAGLAGDRLDLIGEYIDTDVIESSIRWDMAAIYKSLVRDGKMSREEAVERLRGHLRKAIQQKDKVVVGGLVCELKDFAAREAREEVARAFRLHLVDPSLIDEETVFEYLEKDEEWFREEVEEWEPGIEDSVEELSQWSDDGGWDFDDDDEYDLVEDWDVDEEDWEDEEWALSSDEPPPAIEPVGTIRNRELQIGRNDPCPCGSGKKYKKCCGKP